MVQILEHLFHLYFIQNCSIEFHLLKLFQYLRIFFLMISFFRTKGGNTASLKMLTKICKKRNNRQPNSAILVQFTNFRGEIQRKIWRSTNKETELISMMPTMTDSSKNLMFSLALFLSFLILKTGGSSVVAVAGCDGRSDKKELQENLWMMPA